MTVSYKHSTFYPYEIRMKPKVSVLVLAIAAAGSAVHAQGAALPSTKAGVAEWDVAIVKRAEKVLASPAQWDHADTTGDCPAKATTFSITCAIGKAVDEAAGVFGDRPTPATPNPAPQTECVFHASGSTREGSCGELFDELPIFTIAQAKGVTTGAWRKDAQPTTVWAGKMADAGGPVMQEARRLVGVVTTKKYSARLVGYNNDSSTTFADVQKFFALLEDRVRTQAAADMTGGEDVEIELHAGGTGVIRTYNGWFAVSGVSETGTALRFMVDTVQQIAPNAVDRAILRRAATIISSEAVWNRKDDRKCPADATTWSIYCAEEKAMIEITGGFHHRRPASELVRVIVDERSKDKNYSHRLMDYNNDPATKLDDVRSLFAEAIARVKP